MGESQQSNLQRALALNRAMAEVQRALNDLCGVDLRVLFRDGGTAEEVFPPPAQSTRSPFCAIVRKYPDGKTRCAMCRTMIALSASYEGLTVHGCHGGITILASCVHGPRTHAADHYTVVAGPFLPAHDRQRREAVTQHLRSLRVAPADRSAAFEALPVLNAHQFDTGKHLVAIAAGIVGDVLTKSNAGPAVSEVPPPPAEAPATIDLALHTAFACCDNDNNRVPGPGTGNRLVDLIVAVVSRTPDMDFTLSGLARAAQVTPNHLSMLFHRHYGMRFSEFLIEQRIRVAMQRLQDPHLSVEDVARQSGFNTVSYFCKCFRRYTGMTPGRWRQDANPSVTNQPAAGRISPGP